VNFNNMCHGETKFSNATLISVALVSILSIILSGCGVPYDSPQAFPIQLTKHFKLSHDVIAIAAWPADSGEEVGALELHGGGVDGAYYFQITDIGQNNVRGRINLTSPSAIPFIPKDVTSFNWDGSYKLDSSGTPSLYLIKSTRWQRSLLKLTFPKHVEEVISLKRPENLLPEEEWLGSLTGPFYLNAKGTNPPEWSAFANNPAGPRTTYIIDREDQDSIRWKVTMGPSMFYAGPFDLDEDGEDELVFNSTAPCNRVSAGGYEDDAGYIFAYRQNGDLLWKFKTESGGGDAIAHLESNPLRLYVAWQCHQFGDRPTPFTHMFELDPRTGEPQRDEIFDGIVGWPKTNTIDTLQWALRVDQNSAEVEWITRSFNSSGVRIKLPRVLSLASSFYLPNETMPIYAMVRKDKSTVLINSDLDVLGVVDGELLSYPMWQNIIARDEKRLWLIYNGSTGRYISELHRVDWAEWRANRILGSLISHPDRLILGFLTVVSLLIAIITRYRSRIHAKEKETLYLKRLANVTYAAAHPMGHRVGIIRIPLESLQLLLKAEGKITEDTKRHFKAASEYITYLSEFSDIIKVTGKLAGIRRYDYPEEVFLEPKRTHWRSKAACNLIDRIESIWESKFPMFECARQVDNFGVPQQDLVVRKSNMVISPWILFEGERYRPSDLFYDFVLEEILINASKYSATRSEILLEKWNAGEKARYALVAKNDLSSAVGSYMITKVKEKSLFGKIFRWDQEMGVGGLALLSDFLEHSGMGEGIWVKVDVNSTGYDFSAYLPLVGLE